MAGQSQILSYGVNADQAAELTGTLTDLLAANKGVNASQEDAIGAANMIGKALAGQAGALSKAGILLDDRQKKLIQEGDQATRVATIIEVMNQNYGGLAKSLAETDAGKMVQLKNALEGMLESLGKAVTQGLAPMIDKLKEVTDWINGLSPEDTKKITDALMLLGGAILFIYGAIKLVQVGIMAYRAAVMIATAAQWLLNIAMGANPIGLIVLAIVALVTALVLAYQNSETFRNIVNGLFAALVSGVQAVGAWFGRVFAAIPAFIDNVVKGIRFFAMAIFTYMILPLMAVLKLLSYLPGVGGMAKAALGKIGEIQGAIAGTNTPAAGYNPAAQAAQTAAKQGNGTNINVDSKIAVSVPQGTPEAQRQFIQNDTRQVVREEMERSMNRTRRNGGGVE